MRDMVLKPTPLPVATREALRHRHRTVFLGQPILRPPAPEMKALDDALRRGNEKEILTAANLAIARGSSRSDVKLKLGDRYRDLLNDPKYLAPIPGPEGDES